MDDQAPVVGEHGLSDDDLQVMARLALPPKTGEYACAAADAGLAEVSDEELRAISSRPISYREFDATGFRGCLIGRHDNAAIRVEIRCGDVCPDQSMRIVRYDVSPTDCAVVRGVVVDRGRPYGPAGVGHEPACVPPALANEPYLGIARWDGIRYKTMECAMTPSPPWSCIADPQFSPSFRPQYPRDPAKLHAVNEFGCRYDDIVAVSRPDLGPGTEDVDACGHVARYTCGRSMCTRVPTE